MTLLSKWKVNLSISSRVRLWKKIWLHWGPECTSFDIFPSYELIQPEMYVSKIIMFCFVLRLGSGRGRYIVKLKNVWITKHLSISTYESYFLFVQLFHRYHDQYFSTIGQPSTHNMPFRKSLSLFNKSMKVSVWNMARRSILNIPINTDIKDAWIAITCMFRIIENTRITEPLVSLLISHHHTHYYRCINHVTFLYINGFRQEDSGTKEQ